MCYSEAPGSRRGSAAGFVSDMESQGHWQSIGSNSESKSPLSNFPFFKNLTEKKTTRGMWLRYCVLKGHILILRRWTTSKEKRA